MLARDVPELTGRAVPHPHMGSGILAVVWRKAMPRGATPTDPSVGSMDAAGGEVRALNTRMLSLWPQPNAPPAVHISGLFTSKPTWLSPTQEQ